MLMDESICKSSSIAGTEPANAELCCIGNGKGSEAQQRNLRRRAHLFTGLFTHQTNQTNKNQATELFENLNNQHNFRWYFWWHCAGIICRHVFKVPVMVDVSLQSWHPAAAALFQRFIPLSLHSCVAPHRTGGAADGLTPFNFTRNFHSSLCAKGKSFSLP